MFVITKLQNIICVPPATEPAPADLVRRNSDDEDTTEPQIFTTSQRATSETIRIFFKSPKLL